MKNFVTLGQEHIHRINGTIIDKDCVATYHSNNWKEGREKAHELFGVKFSFHYVDDEFDPKIMKYFPRGLINVD